jgi:anaerobic magnesium-protoporphyrin IX monomethyl ester cyclase
VLRKDGVEARILDLNLYGSPLAELEKNIKEFGPAFIGMNCTSPVYSIVRDYAKHIKNIAPGVKVVIGGVHPSVYPGESIENTDIDIAVVGEGEIPIKEILGGKDLPGIRGIAYKGGAGIVVNEKRGDYVDLNLMPFPAYDLYEINKYVHPGTMAKNNPVASMETSRGCFGQCIFCNMRKTRFRFKTEDRIIEEIKYILSLGYREIHFLDDNIAANKERAKKICERILKEKIKFTWYPRGGVRVDSVDEELFVLMKKAGAWTVPFGIESGNQRILDLNKKGISLEQVVKAVNSAKKAGLRTEGYFMLGMLGETESTIKDSINFAKSLDLDLAKFAIAIPLPGTPIFEEYEKQGLIKTKDWSKYTFSASPSEIYEHPTVKAETLDHYYYKAHRDFYFRPKYIFNKLIHSVKTGEIFSDIAAFTRTKWY